MASTESRGLHHNPQSESANAHSPASKPTIEYGRQVPKPEDELDYTVLYPPRVMAGIQPIQRVHLGQYFGAIEQQINLHHEYPGQTFYSIADYHSLTRNPEPQAVRQGTLELATTYLALGLDPSKATLYRQSDVPEVIELAWVLSCITTVSELEQLPTYKDKATDAINSSLGLLSYPVLMAADILALRGTLIPVGKDQLPNVKKAREIARRFNKRYKIDLFPQPYHQHATVDTVLGIDGRKMSGSYHNIIGLFEPFDELKEKVIRIRTDSKGQYERKNPNECTVFHLYSLVAPAEKIEDLRRKYELGAMGYEEAKRELILHIQEYFAEYQERYRKLKADPDFVEDVLREGFMQASEEAAETLEEVRTLIGL
jgi:tryptophanyl-tRNA synthetase